MKIDGSAAAKEAAAVLGLISEIGQKGVAWHALLVSLSRLPVGEKRQVLSARISKELKQSPTQPQGVLRLPNNDVLALVRDVEGSTLLPLVSIASSVLDEAQVFAGALIHEYDLPRDSAQFIAGVTGVSNSSEKTSMPAYVPLPWGEIDIGVLPREIAKVEKMFYRANVENFVRNQFAFRLVTDWELDEDHDEIFISVDYLKYQASAQISDDRWLFQYFTRTLDNRTLKHMGVHNEGQKRGIAYSLNLNIATIISDDFLTYDRLLPTRVRRSHIIEIQAFDFLENAHLMRFVREFLKSRGYRLCIDGVTRETFMLFDWEAMDVDMVKVRWSKDFAASGSSAFRGLVTAVATVGQPEMVLCWCDDDTAVDWGAAVGIKVFQGWYLDGLRKASVDPQRYRLRLRRGAGACSPT